MPEEETEDVGEVSSELLDPLPQAQREACSSENIKTEADAEICNLLTQAVENQRKGEAEYQGIKNQNQIEKVKGISKSVRSWSLTIWCVATMVVILLLLFTFSTTFQEWIGGLGELSFEDLMGGFGGEDGTTAFLSCWR